MQTYAVMFTHMYTVGLVENIGFQGLECRTIIFLRIVGCPNIVNWEKILVCDGWLYMLSLGEWEADDFAAWSGGEVKICDGFQVTIA